MSTKLKPCPHCGGTARICASEHGGPWRYACCVDCASSSAQDTTDEDVTRKWNQRPGGGNPHAPPLLVAAQAVVAARYHHTEWEVLQRAIADLAAAVEHELAVRTLVAANGGASR